MQAHAPTPAISFHDDHFAAATHLDDGRTSGGDGGDEGCHTEQDGEVPSADNLGVSKLRK